MADVAGAESALPSVIVESQTVSRGLSIPGNNRLLCVIGEGSRREVLVNSANGRGNDGLNSTYTSTTGQDGRHFQLSNYPIVPNRTTLLKSGVPLVGLEGTIDGNTFANIYDYKIDVTTGQIELQRSRIYNQGGSDYVPSSANVGNGTIGSLSLIDDSAPEETWTIRCTSVRRDGYGNPVDGYARFTVSGSVSGIPLDGYGAQVTWQSDGVVRNNGILRFSISEGVTAFDVNDTFTIIVVSGILKPNASLIANYIAVLDINDPEIFTDMNAVIAKHGLPDVSANTLSMGAQLAFQNNAPQVMCLEAAPGLPRRTTYSLIDSATGGATIDDLSFPLPVGVIPDVNTEIKLFTINPTTSVRTQILPNKTAFYNSTFTTNPSAFVFGPYVYSYTVVMEDGLVKEGETGTIVADIGDAHYAWFSHSGTTFNSDDVAATFRMHIFGSIAGNDSPAAGFEVTDVSDGKLKLYWSTGTFTDESGNTDLTWRLVDTDPTVQSATILLTQDLVLTAGYGFEAMVIDTKDATFYDAGWTAALEKLEAYELDIIVPLPLTTISAIIQSTLQHCIAMSQAKNRKERVMFTGAMQGLLPANVTGQELAAVEDLGILEGIQGDDPLEILAGNIEDLTNYSVEDAFGSTFRCVYMYPDRIVLNVNGTNTYANGFYMAAALGGWCAATGNVAQPATNKNLVGFSILRDRVYSTSTSESIAQAGITLVEPILGGGRIIWGKTTTNSGFPEEEEISIVFIRDKIAKVCRTALRGFIGQPESDIFATNLLTRVTQLLTSFINQGLITKYANVLVKRDDVEPRQWNINFQVQPTYPVNWIYVKFSVGTF